MDKKDRFITRDKEELLERNARKNMELQRIVRRQQIELDTLKKQYKQKCIDYDTVTNAFFWKVSGPIRSLMDRVKHGPAEHGAAPVPPRRPDANIDLSDTYREERLKAQRETVFEKDILFSIIVPLYNTPDVFLREMIDSVRNQTYGNWELCMADGSDSSHGYVGEICRRYQEEDPRIRYRKLDQNYGISGNTNACLEMAEGTYIGLFDHDDLLHPSALFEVMKAITETGADFVYTDELTFLSPDTTTIITAHQKPDFAPDNLRANNYICHFSVFSRALLGQTELFRSAYDGSQDHDLILRLTERAENIVHIPEFLYFWRSHPQSTSQDIESKEYAINAGQRAVHDSVERMGYRCTVDSSYAFPTIYEIQYALKEHPPVSIVIPFGDNIEQLKHCISDIFEKTIYPWIEIVAVGNEPADEAVRTKLQEIDGMDGISVCLGKTEDNVYALKNLGAAEAAGDILIFLDALCEIAAQDWIEQLLMYVQRPDVGAAGGILYSTSDRIVSGPMMLGKHAEHPAGIVFGGNPRGTIGYMGRICYAQNCTAVSGAFMMVRRDRFKEAGGFDAAYQTVLGDIDFCLRLRKGGYLNVWNPLAELMIQREALSDGAGSEELAMDKAYFCKLWSTELEKRDRYYNDANGLFDIQWI